MIMSLRENIHCNKHAIDQARKLNDTYNIEYIVVVMEILIVDGAT